MRTLRRTFRAGGIALVIGSALLACAAVTGLGDYEITDLDAAVEASAVIDAGKPDATPPVVRPDATPDEPKDAAPEADTPRECPSPCGSPDGGLPIVLVGDGDQPCPAMFTTDNAIASPTANASTPACACGNCSATVSCTSGALTVHNGLNCGALGATFPNADAGGCNSVSGLVTSDAGVVDPPSPVIGACTAPGSGIRAAIATTSKRICAPSVCAGDACTAPPGFATCTLADGNVQCETAELSVRTVVGDDVTITCPACSCTMNAVCMGTLDRYRDVDCTGSKASINTSTCTPQTPGQPIKSIRWTGTPASTSCVKDQAPAPSGLALTKVRTLCCKKTTK